MGKCRRQDYTDIMLTTMIFKTTATKTGKKQNTNDGISGCWNNGRLVLSAFLLGDQIFHNDRALLLLWKKKKKCYLKVQKVQKDWKKVA